MKKLAIMQPYLFPYLGYFQLINAADTFVVYDDVQFIRRGWINRNFILLNGHPHRFTLPVFNTGRSKAINTIRLPDNKAWKKKFFSALKHAYRNAPYLEEVLEIVENTFSVRTDFLADTLKESLELVCSYLSIQTPFIFSSRQYNNRHKKKAERLLDICRAEGASDYINLPGGRVLYDKDFFRQNGINLSFLEYKATPYDQKTGEFIPSLSMLDVMMFNSSQKIRETLLKDYVLT